MRLQIRLKAAYILTVLVCIAAIPTSFNNLAKNFILEDNITIGLISSNVLIFLVIGFIFFGFSLLILNHLCTYQIGKLFSFYLLLISICILLINITLRSKLAVNAVNIIAVISNIVLYNLIGVLTHLNHKKVFKICRWVLIFISLSQLLVSIKGINFGKSFVLLKSYFLTANYIFTVLLILIYLFAYYRNTTHYTQKQIKLILFGLLLGIVTFIVLSNSPILTLVRVSKSQKIHLYIKTAEALSAVELNKDVQSIIMLTGMVVIIIYILIKREYLLEIHHEFVHIIFSILYLIIANIMMFYSSMTPLYNYLFNIIISLPLFWLFSKSRFDRSDIYNHNLIKSLEEERQRISTYLHDEVLQDLITIYHKDESNSQLASLITDIRNLSHDLYPVIVENLGLEKSLAIFVEDIMIDLNVDINYEYLFPAGVIPKYIAVTVYRTVKELVINAVKHAECNRIYIQINGNRNFINIIVEDNGKGFIVKENVKLLKSPHMGLYTVKKQIENLKGQIRLKSDIGIGTRFEIYIPLTENWGNLNGKN